MIFKIIETSRGNTIKPLPVKSSSMTPEQRQEELSNGIIIRTSYQKIYLPYPECKDPRSYLNDNTLNPYFDGKVPKRPHYHPVGSVFNILVYKDGELLEDFPCTTMLNTSTKKIKQDYFSSKIGFFNCLNSSFRGMKAFKFFERFNIHEDELKTEIINAYRLSFVTSGKK